MCLLFGACLWASDEKGAVYPSYDYYAARTHEIKPHRRTIPIEGVIPGFNQLHLKLIVSPSGNVMDAIADGDGKSMEFWPRVRDETLRWKFTPFEENGKAAAAEIEEYIDLVPAERSPKRHVTPPLLRPDSKIAITLVRTGCYGSCPSYAVTVSTQGVLFDGSGFVVAAGRHTDKVDVDKVRKLARQFIAADFYSMDAAYRAGVTDMPTYTLSIAVDGRKKVLEDYAGQWVGMPSVISELEEEVDALAETSRWIEGSDGLVEELKEEKFDFTTLDAQFMLKEAAQRGKTATVVELLGAGVPLEEVLSPKPKGPDMAFPLRNVGWLTSAATHPETLRALIAAGASERDQDDKDLALVGAARSGNLGSAKALIAYGANPNADLNHLILTESGGGMTMQFQGSGNVLFYAAESGNPEMVREILRYDPNVNARGPKGQTPIFAAGDSRYGDKDGARVEIVQLLAAEGAHVNARDNDGNTPLHEIFLTDVEEELLTLGADVNARNNDGETPIFTTVDYDAIPLFIEHGADLSIRNNKGQTVVEAAEEKGPICEEALSKAIEKRSRR
jgi:ankyrin repeat protein